MLVAVVDFDSALVPSLARSYSCSADLVGFVVSHSLKEVEYHSGLEFLLSTVMLVVLESSVRTIVVVVDSQDRSSH